MLKEFKVLLVEDEPSLAKLLKVAIGDNFYSFSLATNGKEGLEIFKKISPDIVITDIMMPDMNGLEMAKELKQQNSDLPIIILSAYSEKEKLLNAIDVGVNKYFIKPFDPEELLEYICSLQNKLGSKLINLRDDFTFNKTSKRLYKEGKYIALSKRETLFFSLLLDTKEHFIDNETLMKRLWDEEINNERLRTFIKRLRQKTSKALISNIKGRGYSTFVH